MSERRVWAWVLVGFGLAGCARAALDFCVQDPQDQNRSFVEQNGRFYASCDSGAP
jgi:hypothetical protein